MPRPSGFIHTGKPQSFVYDIADIFKFETVVPVAFRIAARKPGNPKGTCAWPVAMSFRQTQLLHRIIPTIEEILAAVGSRFPKPMRKPFPCHSQQGGYRRCWSSWLKMLPRGCEDALRLALGSPGRGLCRRRFQTGSGDDLGSQLEKGLERVMQSWRGAQTPNPDLIF